MAEPTDQSLEPLATIGSEWLPDFEQLEAHETVEIENVDGSAGDSFSVGDIRQDTEGDLLPAKGALIYSPKSCLYEYYFDAAQNQWVIYPPKSIAANPIDAPPAPETGQSLAGVEIPSKADPRIAVIEAINAELKKVVEASGENVDYSPVLVRIIREYVNPLERSLTHTRQAVRIYKDAVQHAVDIVQSKRIDFSNDRPLDVSGILGTMLFVALLEFGVIGFIGASLVGGIFRSMKGFTKTVFSSRLAKAVKNARPTWTPELGHLSRRIQQHQKVMHQVMRHKKFSVTDPGPVQKNFIGLLSQRRELVEKLQKEARAVASRGVRGEYKEVLKAQKAAYGWMKDKKAVADTVKKVAKVGKEGKKLPGGLVKGLKTSDTNSVHFGVDPIPLEVHMKMHAQKMFDQSLMRYENIVDGLNGISRLLSAGQSFLNADIVNQLLELELHLPDPQLIEEYNEDWETVLSDPETLQWNTTAEYEKMMWVLILGGEIEEKFWLIRQLREPFRTAISKEEYESLEAAGVSKRASNEWGSNLITRYHVAPYERDSLLRYLEQRFFKGSSRQEILKIMRTLYEDLQQVNEALERETADVSLPAEVEMTYISEVLLGDESGSGGQDAQEGGEDGP